MKVRRIKLTMNKKGQEADSKGIGPIIAAVVAAVVLVIVAIALYNFFSGGGASYLTNLPGFNNTKPLVVDLEMLKYSITTDKVQFYDGTTWRDFEKQGAVELNGKIVKYRNGDIMDNSGKVVLLANAKGAYDSFFKYYFITLALRGGSRDVTKDYVENKIEKRLLMRFLIYPKINTDWSFWLGVTGANPSADMNFKGGDVSISVTAQTKKSDGTYENDKGGAVKYRFDINNNLQHGIYEPDGDFDEFEPVPIKKGEMSEVISNAAIEWRDSALNNPIAIDYYVNINGVITPKTAYACMDRGKYNVNHDLSIDLKQEVKADAKC